MVPTYFGPTNHLPLEGFSLGKPVLYSDFMCGNEQVKNGVISINLTEPKDLSEKLFKLLTDKSFLEQSKLKAKTKYEELSVKIDKNKNTFKELFENYKTLRKKFNN